MPGLWGAAGETEAWPPGEVCGVSVGAKDGPESSWLSVNESVAPGQSDQARTEGSMSYDDDPDGGAVWAAALVLLCVVTAAGLLLCVVL